MWFLSLGQEDSPGGGNGNPLQYSCLGNSVDRGAWQVVVHRVTKSWIWPADWKHIHTHRNYTQYIVIGVFLGAQLVKNLPAMPETPVQFLGWEDSPGEGITYPLWNSWASLVVQRVKNLPAMWETRIQYLGWEDPLEEGMATHSSIHAWRIPKDRKAWWATVHGVAKSWTRLSN